MGNPTSGLATLPRCCLLVRLALLPPDAALADGLAEMGAAVAVLAEFRKGCVARFPCPLRGGRNPGAAYATRPDALAATYASSTLSPLPSLFGRGMRRRLGGVVGRCGGG